ncbi:hypothetical protein EMIHUDRAFT_437195 [Emiliania huxleyi CCMP1516]|uniref:Uncharacterized protein n=2 Tax=Emiliania huxleyi TaxID=2903 RepID=A0A0D3IPI7_EMIH1|nr:hypothetical protein EMIHUDRAFT_437195 [Emiliania huxleyi CCMP1516]EOD13172.1 hypothetical protein EMIHUDRAFT_437195 [Emiliania huxleyi CCMP1516]|eukprot:XP_005765601.1 hypothetical protein EMIHUDRAFT_437195 [Emiliania huxleyi CCMP1516]
MANGISREAAAMHSHLRKGGRGGSPMQPDFGPPGGHHAGRHWSGHQHPPQGGRLRPLGRAAPSRDGGRPGGRYGGGGGPPMGMPRGPPMGMRGPPMGMPMRPRYGGPMMPDAPPPHQWGGPPAHGASPPAHGASHGLQPPIFGFEPLPFDDGAPPQPRPETPAHSLRASRGAGGGKTRRGGHERPTEASGAGESSRLRAQPMSGAARALCGASSSCGGEECGGCGVVRRRPSAGPRASRGGHGGEARRGGVADWGGAGAWGGRAPRRRRASREREGRGRAGGGPPRGGCASTLLVASGGCGVPVRDGGGLSFIM